jgi:microcystin-dependent protein
MIALAVGMRLPNVPVAELLECVRLDKKEWVMSEPYIGEIKMFSFFYPPRGYAWCDGSLLAVNQNQTLFSLISYAYGGSGSSFALPDMRGRMPMGAGNGPGLTPRSFGQKGGEEKKSITTASTVEFTLTVDNLPAHSHGFKSTSSIKDVKATASSTLKVLNGNPTGNTPSSETVISKVKDRTSNYCNAYAEGTADTALHTSSIETTVSNLTATVEVAGEVLQTGSGKAVKTPVPLAFQVEKLSPYSVVGFAIALSGLYPPRS